MVCWWSRLFLALLLLAAGTAWAAPALELDDRHERVDAWPAVTLLSDPGHALQPGQVLARRADFAPSAGPQANLGQRHDTVWLRLPLRALGQGRWVLELDYPSLNQVDLYLYRNGSLLQHGRMGSELAFEQRPLRSRAHAMALQLEPGVEHELLLRVRSSSSMVLPITLHRADAHLPHEGRRQLLQGLMLGVSLALLVYSLVHALALRDLLFASYGVMVAGLTVFFAVFGGVAQQHLGLQASGHLAKVAPLGVLVAIASGSVFVANALDLRLRHPRLAAGLHAVAAAALAGFVLSVLGLLDYRATQALSTALGLLPMLLAVGPALLRARQGDRAAQAMLLGWAVYLVGAASMAALLRGLLPAHFWTLHLFQLSTLLEAVVWMRVLSLRVQAMQRQAERAELEHSALHSLAHTDALTGLPNRRGLNEYLLPRLARRTADSPLMAIYLLDLDGFKAVNDSLGHDAGDSLLVQLAHRLRAQVRSDDVVARLGGDEFVVVADRLASEADARAVGAKLLAAVETPFDLAGQRCRVGLTAGFAIAPLDGQDATQLLKLADSALYAGKQAGRHRVMRARMAVAGPAV